MIPEYQHDTNMNKTANIGSLRVSLDSSPFWSGLRKYVRFRDRNRRKKKKEILQDTLSSVFDRIESTTAENRTQIVSNNPISIHHMKLIRLQSILIS